MSVASLRWLQEIVTKNLVTAYRQVSKCRVYPGQATPSFFRARGVVPVIPNRTETLVDPPMIKFVSLEMEKQSAGVSERLCKAGRRKTTFGHVR